MKKYIMATLLASLAASANASMQPAEAQCKATLQVISILPTNQQVEIRVTETNCPFLGKGQRAVSDSFPEYKKLKKDQVLQGEVANASVMGPGGVVEYNVFISPSFKMPSIKISF